MAVFESLPPLGEPCRPTAVPRARILLFNDALAADLGLGDHPWASSAPGLALLSGAADWPGTRPYATRYGGHQFGTYTRELGDGRAHIVHETRSPAGVPVQVQLKGSGPTPFSRGLDGRSVLRAALREYLACEAMHALGVPTTRALALVGSSLRVTRDGRTETAAVLVRTAPSFLRFGHLQWLADHGHAARIPQLIEPLSRRPPPEGASEGRRLEHALSLVVTATAGLIAQWQTLGFCHGVMNTDNASLLGLTLDFGPFAFMDTFRPHHVSNASDVEGRYAWPAQRQVGHWNCARLLDACRAALPPRDADAILERLLGQYVEVYNTQVMQRWRSKLGWAREEPGDATLLNRWLTLMAGSRLDFTLAFRLLSQVSVAQRRAPDILRRAQRDPAAFDAWMVDYLDRLARDAPAHPDADRLRARAMNAVNPAVVLRTHLAQAAIDRAEEGHMDEAQALLRALMRPFEELPGLDRFRAAPASGQATGLELSCSS